MTPTEAGEGVELIEQARMYLDVLLDCLEAARARIEIEDYERRMAND